MQNCIQVTTKEAQPIHHYTLYFEYQNVTKAFEKSKQSIQYIPARNWMCKCPQNEAERNENKISSTRAQIASPNWSEF